VLKYKTIAEWLTYIFSSTGAIFLLESIELKIEKSNINFLKKYESMVMNMMRLLVFIFVVVTNPKAFRGADSMFLYIQYR
jgi:hypothetical protein